MAEQLFHLAPGRGIVARTSSGLIDVRAEPREDVIVTRGYASVNANGDLEVSAAHGSGGIEVRCPEGTRVSVGTAKGATRLSGRLSKVLVTSASGAISVEHAEAADLRTASGLVELKHCSGPCRVKTMSGRIGIGRAAGIDVSTVSGRVDIRAVDGPVKIHSVSGTVDLRCERAVDAKVKTMSGPVTLKVPRGVRPNAVLKALTGKARFDCQPGSDCNLDVRTLSGRIEVLPA